MKSPFTRLGLLAALGLAVPPLGAQTFTANDRQPTPEELSRLPAVVADKVEGLLKDVGAPPEFQVTLFATPPAVNYPVFVAAATDGTLYVSSDGNGSLDRKPHLGRVLRVRDTNGDGQGDEVKAFVADVDSPRGLVWDHDRLYLLHPPDVSVFIDRDGDGVADGKQTLIRGIGWTFKDRPADHGSNGLTLGIDGWLYAAIGDFGFLEAVGTDGTRLQMRGGGVVRFRPDGSGLETWADGTRNILEVALSPELEGFTRDNTNDGGGWDIRLHHFSGRTQHGYPRLFKNFGDEIIQPLADYGGGSGCGAAWIDEPGLPARWNNAPFTADWGRDRVFHHGLTPKGATMGASQEEFLRLPRVTDLDVDGNSAVYAASWKGASFTWVGPEVGFIARVAPKGYTPPAMPDFETLAPEKLVEALRSPSHRRRLEAQRTLLRRIAAGRTDRKAALAALRDLVADASVAKASRIAAVNALALGWPTESKSLLGKRLADEAVAPAILHALAGSARPLGLVAPDRIGRLLDSRDPVVRRSAANAASRLAGPASVPALARHLADSDPIVAHAVVRALTDLSAADACLKVVDQATATGAARTAALRVLQSLHQTRVVDGLLQRLETEKEAARRAGLITALCRLHFQEGPWKGDSWGTRPDTRGPYYQPEAWEGTARIAAALKAHLSRAEAAEAAHLGREFARHRIPAGDALDTLLARAASEASLLPAVAGQLAEAEEIPAKAVPLLVRAAEAAETPDAARAQAVIALTKTVDPGAWHAVLRALPKVQSTKSENNLAEKAANAFRNAPKLDQVHGVFETVAAEAEGPASALAEAAVLRLASRKVGAPEARAAANASLDAGWSQPKRRLQILKAAVQIGDASRAAAFVTALDDPDPAISKTARETIGRLKIDPDRFRAEAKAAKVGDLPVEEVLAQVQKTSGDATRGGQLFGQIGCNGCHTVKADEPLKGPYLGTIATVYKRRELAEAILLPNKTLAQGFVANHFELKDGTEVDGFVVREAADAVTVRTIAAVEQTLPVSQITRREKQQRSLMPEGLAAGLTVRELASVLEYLERLPTASK
jgi:putative membrane-bound dehydrogenase-like protein